ncbi:MAG: hypothetical protein NZ519_04265 [Bacteroidia bacterium]|nr:hypothetical protein [Bacteroidia bacterium]
MGVRCNHAHKVGVLRATCGMPRTLAQKGAYSKNIIFTTTNTILHLVTLFFPYL